MTRYKETPYQTYLSSEVWKCKEAPSGAHHWVEHKNLPTGSVFQCVHCGEEKVLNNLVKSNP
ncbi:hypothetical protein ACFLVH_03390 [Chloroflexota bacterium]